MTEEEDTHKLNLDQLWLDPNFFSDDIAFEDPLSSRSHAWQRRTDLRQEEAQGSGTNNLALSSQAPNANQKHQIETPVQSALPTRFS